MAKGFGCYLASIDVLLAGVGGLEPEALPVPEMQFILFVVHANSQTFHAVTSL